jgi:DNA repair ATPase RecN
MIPKIEIKDFRTITRQKIELGPGVTTIIGESAEGKSTTIRALRWVVLNKPTGDKVINWNAEKAMVRVTVDGKSVIRKKGKGINSYKLDSKEFKAFGSGKVPEPIDELFNLSSINFQGQFEAPFWFCETPGEVSRQLNSIVNLEVIDSSLASISSDIRKTKTNMELIQNRIKEAQQQSEDLKYVDEMNEEFQEIENLQKDIENLTQRFNLLQNLLKDGTKYLSTYNRCRKLKELGEAAAEKKKEYVKIKESVENLTNLLKEGVQYVKILKNKPPSLESLRLKALAYEEIVENKRDLESLIDSFQNHQETICQAEQRKKDLEKQMKQLIGKVCPLCKMPIT